MPPFLFVGGEIDQRQPYGVIGFQMLRDMLLGLRRQILQAAGQPRAGIQERTEPCFLLGLAVATGFSVAR
ncbi:MAG: hypothetical protein R3F44_01250 [Candidatus Competibacteraceae bacterium]